MSIVVEGPLQLLRSLFVINARRELKELYVFLLLFSLASSLITIFEPIFLYQLGFSVAQIALYYALHYIIYLFLLPLGGAFAAQWGYERSLTLSTPLLIIYFIALAGMQSVPELFWVAFILLALHKIFFWPAFHTNFARNAESGNQGTEQSVARMLVVVTGIIGPLAGGLLAARFGFQALFLVAAVTLFFAGIPLLRTRETYTPRPLPYKEVWTHIFSRNRRNLTIASWGWGADLITLGFWPLFIFLLIQEPARVGTIVALGVAVGTLWAFLVGELSDRFGPRKILRWLVPVYSLTFFIRMLVRLPIHVLPAHIFSVVGTTGVEVPFVSSVYTAKRGVAMLLRVLTFEMMLSLAKAVVALIVMVFFLTLPLETAFAATFILAAFMGLFMLRL